MFAVFSCFRVTPVKHPLLPSAITVYVACFPFLSLILSSVCVVVRACLSQVAGEGGGRTQRRRQEKTTGLFFCIPFTLILVISCYELKCPEARESDHLRFS